MQTWSYQTVEFAKPEGIRTSVRVAHARGIDFFNDNARLQSKVYLKDRGGFFLGWTAASCLRSVHAHQRACLLYLSKTVSCYLTSCRKRQDYELKSTSAVYVCFMIQKWNIDRLCMLLWHAFPRIIVGSSEQLHHKWTWEMLLFQLSTFEIAHDQEMDDLIPWSQASVFSLYRVLPGGRLGGGPRMALTCFSTSRAFEMCWRIGIS